MYKVLIVDDNHSFIDSLKLALKQYPLQFVSHYKFQEARTTLQKFGNYQDRTEIGEILKYHQNMKDHEKSAQDEKKSTGKNAQPPEKLHLKRPPFDEEGFFMVIVEQNCETATKGLQFINEIMRTQKGWKSEDFIIMSSRIEEIEAQVKKMDLISISKPLRQGQIKQAIEGRLKSLISTQREIEALVEMYQITVQPDKKGPPLSKKAQSVRKSGASAEKTGENSGDSND